MYSIPLKIEKRLKDSVGDVAFQTSLTKNVFSALKDVPQQLYRKLLNISRQVHKNYVLSYADSLKIGEVSIFDAGSEVGFQAMPRMTDHSHTSNASLR